MKDYITLGPTPGDESCAQLGSDNYYDNARKEGRAYINQLRRTFPDLPPGVTFTLKANPHDFGTYHEVNVVFDTNNEAAVKAAYNIDENVPAEWDAEARTELGLEPSV